MKYRAISKKRQTLLQTIKWTGNSYALETHVYNHRQAYGDLRECSTHITVPVPSNPQRVEYLIDSITSKDSTLQASIGLVRANTNNMGNDFEGAANILIEIDPYRRSTRTNTRDSNVSAIDFSAGRWNTGVDLCFHHKHKFFELPQEQKEELTNWLSTNDGKKAKKAFFSSKKKTNSDTTGYIKNERKSDGNAGSNWKKKIKNALKSDKWLKSVMAILAEGETSNHSFASALSTVDLPPIPVTLPIRPPGQVASVQQQPPSPFISKALPATSLKLRSVLKR